MVARLRAAAAALCWRRCETPGLGFEEGGFTHRSEGPTPRAGEPPVEVAAAAADTPVATCESTALRYSDEKVANREIRVWHFVIENGY
jgi:hypothetical protein